MAEIKFGTDGWRAIIGEDFIPENISRVIQAFCDVKKQESNKLIFVGYDRRLRSEQSARLVAEILGANGFEVRLTTDFCPTPCVSWLVKTNQALAGVMITASHNPSNWNGIKFKESNGGAASPEYTGEIEEQIKKNDASERDIVWKDLQELGESGVVKSFDPKEEYVHHLRNFVDVDAIREAKFKIAVDPLFGAGTGFVKEVLEQDVFQIHDLADTDFGGLNPEPIEKNLSALKETIVKNKLDVGLATDGDADRIGAMDQDGRFINSHQIFSLLLRHNLSYRKLSGVIVKSFSTTKLIDRICEKHGLKMIETPIGFKHISQELKKHDALMGGEESGGISLRDHVHERDGVLNGLLLLEMMAVNKKSMQELLQDMEAEYGPYRFYRDDYHLTDAKVTEVKARLEKQDVKEAAGLRLDHYETTDGTKLIFEDQSWLLIRASGTEPLLRVYAESSSDEKVRALLDFAKSEFKLA